MTDFVLNLILKFMENNYIYTQSWEDGEVDLDVYKLDKDSNVLMITTGGDNVLNYLAHGVKSVTSVDMNRNQNHLLEIKRAIIITQTRENALEILGKSNYNLLLSEWSEIKKEMSPEAVLWWSRNLYKFKSFWNSGIVGIFSRVMNTILRFSGLRPCIDDMIETKDVEEQTYIYGKYEKKFNRLAWICEKLSTYLIPFMGVPLRQYQLHDDPRIVSNLFKRILTNQPLFSNYFFRPYISNKGWCNECCPLYLRESHFSALKTRLNNDKNCLKIETNKMENIETCDKFNRMILLDHLDWMKDEMIIDEFSKLTELSTDDCLFCFRSFSTNQPFACLRHLDYIYSDRTFNEDQTPNKYTDRVAMYNSVHVAKKKVGKDLLKVNKPEYSLRFVDSLKIFGSMMIQPFTGLGLNNREFMNHYYESQAKYYDAYRQNMLHGKKPLMFSIPWDEMEGKKVLLLAGGTGDLTDYFKKWIPSMKSVTISDISKPMIKVATERINKNKWTNVDARIEDILDDNDFHTSEESSYDLVICTYSLTMIPDWEKTMDTALRYLKKDGIFAVSDFTVTNKQSSFGRFFWKSLFSKSHINLNDNHVKTLQSKCKELYLRHEYGDFPHVPLLTCPYYYGLFLKK